MEMIWSQMKRNKLRFLLPAVTVIALAFSVRASDESDVRGMVNKVFEQLKSHDYAGLYDVLPGSARNRMSRDRFVNALQRAQDTYELDRMDVGPIKVSGNLAVVDTVLYGRVSMPIQAEGKIVVQQYLIKEDGNWRVATGDQSSIKKFLASNPAFGKGFKIKAPRIYMKQDDKWIEFAPPQRKRK
jgi:hypothetical protein